MLSLRSQARSSPEVHGDLGIYGTSPRSLECCIGTQDSELVPVVVDRSTHALQGSIGGRSAYDSESVLLAYFIWGSAAADHAVPAVSFVGNTQVVLAHAFPGGNKLGMAKISSRSEQLDEAPT